MAEGKGENWLVWGVLALMLLGGVAALALSPGGPGGPGPNTQNAPPIPRIAPQDASVNLGDTVNFDGANSTDPDGTVRAFAWDFGDGFTGSGAIVSHKYEITGAFRVRLEITDDDGAKNATTTNVWVNLDQPIPFATATRNRLSGNFPSNIAFPVDPNATRLAVRLDLNTSSPAGAKAIVSLLDPNQAVAYTTNMTLAFGQVPSPLSFELDAANITLDGQWTLRVEADYLISSQPSVTVGFSGSVRVDYRP